MINHTLINAPLEVNKEYRLSIQGGIAGVYRSSSAFAGDPLTFLPANPLVTVLEIQPDWLKIKFNSYVGYISRDKVLRTETQEMRIVKAQADKPTQPLPTIPVGLPEAVKPDKGGAGVEAKADVDLKRWRIELKDLIESKLAEVDLLKSRLMFIETQLSLQAVT